MTAPAQEINRPDPGAAGGWGPEITATRDNLVFLMICAAANGSRLPGWSSTFTYGGGSGELTVAEMIYQADTTIKMKWVFAYSGGLLNTETWYFDKGLGAGYEELDGGTLTMTYSSGNMTAITST